MVLGITGCPGSGKSLLAEVIAHQGWILVDVDRMGHEIVEQDSGVKQNLITAFGRDIVGNDGRIERKALSRKVFTHPDNIHVLNDIVHPLLIRNMKSYIEESRLKGENVVVDCALIFEWNIEGIFDIIVCVTADEMVRKERLRHRDGRTEKEIDGMYHAQLSEHEKSRRADIVLMNCASIERIKVYGLMLSELPRYFMK